MKMPRRFSPPSPLTLSAWVAAFILLVSSILPSVELSWLRGTAAITVALTFVSLLYTGDPRTILAPSFPIGVSATVLILLVPGMLPQSWTYAQSLYDSAIAADGLLAGRLLAGFIAIAMLISTTIVVDGAKNSQMGETRIPSNFVLISITILTLVLSGIYGLGFRGKYDFLRPLFGNFLAEYFYMSITPILCIAVGALTIFSIQRTGLFLLLIISMCGLIGAIGATLTSRNALMIIAAVACALVLTPNRIHRGTLIAGVAFMIALGGGSAVTIFKMRQSNGSIPDYQTAMSKFFMEKVGERSTLTFLCFSNAIKESKNSEPKKAPYYFISGLVPRFFWPSKPTLSEGDLYSARFCNSEPDATKPGSMSVSLLGEPIIDAGWFGLTAALFAWFFLIAAFSRLAIALGPPGMGWLIAMTPWLTDFDQSFTLYIAQGVKSALIMAPFLFVWWWWNAKV